MNTIYYGDNLYILREHIADESGDLIYLDSPFNSKRVYNVYLRTPKRHASDAQYEFQYWACSLVVAQPYQNKKKGADTGIDSLIFLQDDKGEAVSAGYYDSQFGAFPKIQILTIEDLLSGKEGPRYPDMARGGLNFKKAKKEKGKDQPKLYE